MLADVSLAVEAGTVTGLLGPSGSGKTTLMRSIVGVQLVDGGRVTVLRPPGGLAGAAAAGRLRDAGPSVYADLTVRENLRYFARDPRRAAERIDEMIETVALGGQAARSCARSPGGERSRVSLATALLGGPDCSCSTSRPSGSTRCCAATSGRRSTACRRRHDAARLQPRHGRGLPLRPAPAPPRRPHRRSTRHAGRRCVQSTGARQSRSGVPRARGGARDAGASPSRRRSGCCASCAATRARCVSCWSCRPSC